jgi:hypothetical protein
LFRSLVAEAQERRGALSRLVLLPGLVAYGGDRFPQAPAAESTPDRVGSSAGTDEFAQDQGASTEIHLIYGG